MKTGRPRKELDYPILEKLCAICATEIEIANWFDMGIDTLNSRCKENYDITFSEVYKKFADEGRMSLRRKQMQIALDGNVTMLIWLGKNMLGQKDTPFIEQHTHFTKIAKLEIPAAFKSQDEWEKFVEHLKADSATTHNAQLPGV